jgi:hypothetical protein
MRGEEQSRDYCESPVGAAEAYGRVTVLAHLHYESDEDDRED